MNQCDDLGCLVHVVPRQLYVNHVVGAPATPYPIGCLQLLSMRVSHTVSFSESHDRVRARLFDDLAGTHRILVEHWGLARDRVTVEIVVGFGGRHFEEVHLDVVAQLIMFIVKHDLPATSWIGHGDLGCGVASARSGGPRRDPVEAYIC